MAGITIVGTPTVGSGSTITAPSGLAAHDMLLVIGNTSSGVTPTTPSGGWNQTRAGAVGFCGYWVGWLDWASGSSWTLTSADTTVCCAYRGVDLTAPFSAENVQNGGSGLTISTPSITNPATNWLVGAFGNAANYNYSAFSQSATIRGQGGASGHSTLVDTNGPGASGSQAITATMWWTTSDNMAWIGSLKPLASAYRNRIFSQAVQRAALG